MSFESSLKSLFIALALPLTVAGQKDAPITLVNPSFEDVPKSGETPSGWYNCGDTKESPPDIQPGCFSVVKAPAQGETYMGLVVRDNETWESVGQRLSKPLEANKCYEFSLDICRSELYLSMSRTTGEEVNYSIPAVVRIWGGMGYCDKKEMLAQTSQIVNTRWLTYNFRFTPKKGSYTYIMIEAYYKTPVLFPYNGNLLIDNASTIRPVPCDEKMPPAKKDSAVIAKKTTPAVSKTGTKTPTPTKTTSREPAKAPDPTPPSDKFERKNLKKGATIRMENIYFDADKADVKIESEPALMEMYNFLIKNQDVVVEIGGHTNNIPSHEFCDSLSTSRAKSVASWLVNKGIGQDRVQYKGYGKRQPIVNNVTAEGRRKNQRVEIKILKING